MDIFDLCNNRFGETESKLIAQLQSIIRLNPSSLNARDDNGRTPLHVASMGRTPEFCQILLGGDVFGLRSMRAVDDKDWLPFHQSCQCGNVKTAKFLHRLFPESINMRTNDGAYPLHLFLSGGYYIASEDDEVELVRFLLQNNQRAVSIATNDGSLPLHLACRQVSSLKVVEVVCNVYPEAVCIQDNYGDTPLDLLLIGRCKPNQDSNVVELVRFLMERNQGAASFTRNGGRLPLHLAFGYFTSLKAVEVVYNAKPEAIYIRDNYGRTPLDFLLGGHCNAKQNDVVELVRFLIRHDQLVMSILLRNESLPLHLTCRNLTVKIVEVVYNAYPEAISIPDNDGDTPLDIARERNPHGHHCPQLLGFLKTQRDFINQACEELVADSDGQLPIHQALQNTKVSIGTIKLMLTENPESLRVANNQGLIPLHLACQLRRFNIVKFLVEADESTLKICDTKGNFPLHHACARGKCETVNFIMEKSVHEVALHNGARKLPIHLLVESNCDKRSKEYIEAIWRFLRENPAMLMIGDSGVNRDYRIMLFEMIERASYIHPREFILSVLFVGVLHLTVVSLFASFR